MRIMKHKITSIMEVQLRANLDITAGAPRAGLLSLFQRLNMCYERKKNCITAVALVKKALPLPMLVSECAIKLQFAYGSPIELSGQETLCITTLDFLGSFPFKH